jgi:hypothetical protein
VTALRVTDPTNALRSRRWRERKKRGNIRPDATVDAPGVTVSTIEMCALASRLRDGRATPGDLQMAERLIMQLVYRLPADSAIDVR